VFLSVQADLSLSINDVPVGSDGLKGALERLTAGDHEQRIYLRADQAVPYGDLMQSMNALRAAGYRRIALVGLEQRSE